MSQVKPPFTQYFDLNGDPLNNGYIYIGKTNLNPETNPIIAYWDSSLTIPVAQPIRTINGYLARNGSPSNVYTSSIDCSMTIKDKNGNLIAYVPVASGESNSGLMDVRWFGAKGDGVNDDSPAFQSALNVAVRNGFGGLYIPAGNYLLNSLVSTTTLGFECTIIGDGLGVTNITVGPSNNSGAISLTFTDFASQVTVKEISIIANGQGRGTALTITQPYGGNRHNRGVVIENVEVKGKSATTDYFNNGINLTGVWRPYLNNVLVSGPFGFTDLSDASLLFKCSVGINIDECYGPTIQNCYIWSAYTGISNQSVNNPGPEGFTMYGTVINGVRVGFKFLRPGREPTLWITDCHVNYRDVGYDINGVKLAEIKGCVPYNEDKVPNYLGTPYDFHFQNSEVVVLTGNMHHFAGNTTRVNVYFDSTVYASSLSASNNIYNSTANTAILIGSTAGNCVLLNNSFPGLITTNVNDQSGTAIIVNKDTTVANLYEIESQDNGAGGAPILGLLRRSASPAVNDSLANIRWRGMNTLGAIVDYVSTRAIITDPTATSENSTYEIFTQVAGVATKQLSLSGGAQLGSPTGGAKGTGSINAAGSSGLLLMANGGAGFYFNAGTPEGVITATVGSICMNTAGGALTSFYVKESGSGNTGWVAK